MAALLSTHLTLGARGTQCAGYPAGRSAGTQLDVMAGGGRRGSASFSSISLPWNPLVKFTSIQKRSAARNAPPRVVKVKMVNEYIGELDDEKKSALKYRRTVFAHSDWDKHRSSGRHLRHILTMVGSRVMRALAPPVLSITLIATLVVAWNFLIQFKWLPACLPLLRLNPVPFSLTAPALSFLLVFRTNSSYSRFDEARKMWGLMINRTRDTARLALSYFARNHYSDERPKLRQFLRHLQAFPLAYKHHLVQEGSLEEDLRTLTTLSDKEIYNIIDSPHKPNYILQMMSECVHASAMHPVHKQSIDQNLATFADDVGGSERILKTPIPLSYTRLTSRFMVIWHAFLPLALWDICGWATIPVAFLTAAAFFCTEEVGVVIEEPFSILPLDAIAATARDNVAELIMQHPRIKSALAPNDVPIDSVPENLVVPELTSKHAS